MVLSVDFNKAFDRLEFGAIDGMFEYFKFSLVIRRWIQILYKDFKAVIQNAGNFSTKINIDRSVHQGAPGSGIIFICVVEIMSHMLKANHKIKGFQLRM